MGEVVLKNIVKNYGDVKAVKNVSLEIKDKEFTVFVGPSGCGKSTMLRMIAGLEEITSGELYIDGKLVNDVTPKQRDISMVFQNYALYPHMNIYDNMAFSLKLSKMPRDIIDNKVRETAKTLGISDLLDRKPSQISGGQRQRVALGRAVVREPKVFLMDEPLSNLDAKLRVQMRAELKLLHQKVQTTFVYVTHDQVEAMTMGDRLVVLKDGVIQQVDSPLSLFNMPKNIFVAGFIGTPAMNFLHCRLTKVDGNYILSANGEVSLTVGENYDKARLEPYLGKEVVLGIRPEHIYDAKLLHDSVCVEENTVTSKVSVIEPLGSETLVFINIEGENMIAKVSSDSQAEAGSEICLFFDMDKAHIFDAQSEENLMFL